MGLVRFGVSLESELLHRFDRLCADKKYKNRSEAIRDLIRDEMVKEEWSSTKSEVTAVIALVYDHHRRDLVDNLTDIQHDNQDMVISSQHIHLDHDNCLEVIAVRGRARDLEKLADSLRSAKGVKHGGLIMATTGKAIK